MMKNLLTLLTVLALLAGTAYALESQPQGKPDRVLKKGDWEFRIYYRAKGTRSEGQHGVLIFKGKEVPPGNKGDEKHTPFGLMMYYGSDYAVLWDITGWNFKDRRKILTSAKAKHPAE